jgi:hypothetical protein
MYYNEPRTITQTSHHETPKPQLYKSLIWNPLKPQHKDNTTEVLGLNQWKVSHSFMTKE